MNRRRLIKNTTFAAAGATFAGPLRAAGTGTPKKLRVGLIGCGGRGNFIAGLMTAHGGYEIVAGADYFQDKLDAFGAKFKVSANKLYAGRFGFRKMIEDGDIDAVAHDLNERELGLRRRRHGQCGRCGARRSRALSAGRS